MAKVQSSEVKNLKTEKIGIKSISHYSVRAC